MSYCHKYVQVPEEYKCFCTVDRFGKKKISLKKRLVYIIVVVEMCRQIIRIVLC